MYVFLMLVFIAYRHVPVIGYFIKPDIRHSQFITVIIIRRAAHRQNKSGEHFGGKVPEFRAVISKPAHQSCLVMIGKENGEPAPVGKSAVPAAEHFLKM